MKGRESLAELQAFLETVIIKAFTVKYTLLPKKREIVTPAEVDLWNLYNKQEKYFKGKFCEF